MYKKRTLESTLPEYSNSFKIVVVTGSRQIGKTTLLKYSAQSNRKYVTLDDPQDLLKAKKDPHGFLLTYKPPVIIDEIQYAPELFKYIKMTADNSDVRGQIWLTGSQTFNMIHEIAENLPGRAVIINMFGFSIYERFEKGLLQKPFLPTENITSTLEHKSPEETFRIIWQGSFPDVTEKNYKERTAFYDSYVKTYLERDIRQIINVSNEVSFITFLKVIAARTGQQLKLTNIAEDIGISVNTVKNWLSILQISGLVFLLKPYFKNITKRLIKTPKLYFMDTGLAAYLAGWTTPESLETGISAGAFFETFVISEIVKSYYHNGLTPNLYYYRDSNKNEIDLLIYQDGKFHPIEIKKTATPKEEDIKAFKIFSKAEKIAYGTLICLTDEKKQLNENSTAISIWDI